MRIARLIALAAILAGCGGGVSSPPLAPQQAHSTGTTRVTKLSAGLGKVLTSKSGGQIYGFDIDQHGKVGVIATASNYSSDVETFDESTGAILKTYPSKLPAGTSYGADGIFADHLALVTRYVVPAGSIYAKRFYNVIKPVGRGRFTGKWKPPVKDIQVEAAGPNQTTSTTALYAIELKSQDKPDLLVADLASNSTSHVFHLDPNVFDLADDPQFAQDPATNQGVFALSPDGGAVGGSAPLNIIIDLSTGNETEFAGFNNGYYHAGDVNGLAVDPNTGIAATDTELNAQVEFYNLAKQTGTYTQLPCTGSTSQYNSGSGIANDPVNGLFLVTEYYYCSGSKGSAIVVYDESGNLVETITGFQFFIGEPAPAINPATRMGWAFGPRVNQLQQFFY